ncbi:surface protease GP63, putative, partial [Trypanosoma cruzi]
MLLLQCMLAVACGGCCLLRCHEEKGGEGVRSPCLLSCGCGAPRVTALSWAPHP